MLRVVAGVSRLSTLAFGGSSHAEMGNHLSSSFRWLPAFSGFSGVSAATAAQIAKVLFVIFLVIFVITLILAITGIQLLT